MGLSMAASQSDGQVNMTAVRCDARSCFSFLCLIGRAYKSPERGQGRRDLSPALRVALLESGAPSCRFGRHATMIGVLGMRLKDAPTCLPALAVWWVSDFA